jgi:hypothetical protein
MMPRGIPAGLDADTTKRIARSFLIVRVVRGTVLLLFLAVAEAGVEVRGWPSWVTVAIAVAMLLQAGALGADIRRLARTKERPHRP